MNDDRACAVTHEQYKIEKRKQRIANIKLSDDVQIKSVSKIC